MNSSPPGSLLCAYATLELAVVNPTRHKLRISLFPIDASPAELITGLLLRDVTE